MGAVSLSMVGDVVVSLERSPFGEAPLVRRQRETTDVVDGGSLDDSPHRRHPAVRKDE